MRRFLSGEGGADTDLVQAAYYHEEAAVAPIVIAELFSEPTLQGVVRAVLSQTEILPIHDGYWERAGELRASLRSQGLKAKLADCLIAQSCIDNDAPLITYDRDFRHFERAGLRVI